MLYYVCRDPALHEAGALARDALDALGAAAMAWADSPSDETQTRVWAAAVLLRARTSHLDAVGARLWPEHDPAAGDSR